jgi:hypothetical protein
MAEYAAYRPAAPYFDLVRRALGDLVEGEHFFDIVTDDVVYESGDRGLAGSHPGSQFGLQETCPQASPEQFGGNLELWSECVGVKDSGRLQRGRVKFAQEAAFLEFPAAATRTRIIPADLPQRIGYRTRGHQLVQAGRRMFYISLSFRAKTIPARQFFNGITE